MAAGGHGRLAGGGFLVDESGRAVYADAQSEVRFVRHWDVVVEQVLVVLRARLFMHRHLDTPQFADCRPRLIERVRVLDPESHLERLSIVH
jgi:hypothetical protein